MLEIAWITLRRITERSILVQFGVLALVLIYVGLGLDKIIMVDAASSEQSGLGVGAVFLSMFTVFWSTIEIPREIDRKEVHVYLAKPISRLQYVVGKYLGMTGMVLAGEAVLMLVFAGCVAVKGQHPTSAFLSGTIRLALFLALLNALCVAASMLISEVQAMVTVLVVAALGGVIFAAAVLAWSAYDGATAALFSGTYYLLPNLLHYRWEPEAAQLPGYLASLTLYTVGWCTICLLIALAMFDRMDLP